MALNEKTTINLSYQKLVQFLTDELMIRDVHSF